MRHGTWDFRVLIITLCKDEKKQVSFYHRQAAIHGSHLLLGS